MREGPLERRGWRNGNDGDDDDGCGGVWGGWIREKTIRGTRTTTITAAAAAAATTFYFLLFIVPIFLSPSSLALSRVLLLDAAMGERACLGEGGRGELLFVLLFIFVCGLGRLVTVEVMVVFVAVVVVVVIMAVTGKRTGRCLLHSRWGNVYGV